MLYLLAAWTGFRRNELGSLTPRSFRFDDDTPTVTVEAAFSKRRRRDVQPLHRDIARRVKQWIEKRGFKPDDVILPVSEAGGATDRDTAEMMKRDLTAARSSWIADAETDQERKRRESSDFLRYKDSRGHFADFHALRHTFITNLCRSGIAPRTAQPLARHCDIRLTMNTYTHIDQEEQAAAINSLPSPG